MLDSLISALAPHYCFSCGEIGSQICDNCYYDIELSPRETCFMCHRLLTRNRCNSCKYLDGVTQLVLAEREGVLARLIDAYKFSHTRGTDRVLARLLDDNSPHFPAGSHIVPLPTASPHIRQRGFDHTYDISRRFARARKLMFSPVVARTHNKAQVGAERKERFVQASSAYKLRRGATVEPNELYIIFDDIITTGASMTAMVRLLKEHGASRIICLALLQQPWQK